MKMKRRNEKYHAFNDAVAAQDNETLDFLACTHAGTSERLGV
jgi:hypothetical protein